MTSFHRHSALAASFVSLALFGLPAAVAANGASQPSLLIDAPAQAMLHCRPGLCPSNIGYAPADTAQPWAGSASSAPSLHFVRGAWRLAWSRGFTLNYAFQPMLTRANITYDPGFSFRSHEVRVTATFYFF